MALPARFAPVLLTVGDPAPNDDWDYTIESIIGVIELPTPNVDLTPLITAAKDGNGVIERRVVELDDPGVIVDGDTLSIETQPLFANVMASDPTQQIGGAYEYTLTLRGDDPRLTGWSYTFRFIIDGDASYSLVGDAIPVAQVSSIDPVDPENPEWVALQSTVADLQDQIDNVTAETNLGYTASPTEGVVTSDTGTDATIPLGDTNNAGLLSPGAFDQIVDNASAASAAQSDATQALADAGAAQSDATQALADAAAVQSDSVQTLTNKTLDSLTNEIHADVVHLEVRNESGGLLTKGTPVYYSGYSIGQDKVLVSPTDASARATMLCLGLLAEDLANNATGELIRTGRIYDIDTSAWSAGDQLFVSETPGELTNVEPTGAAYVQHVAEVMRSHASLGAVSLNLSADHRTGLANQLMEDGTQAEMRSHIDAASLSGLLTDYNTAVAAYGPIDTQITTTRTLQNAALVPSATLYTFTRTAVYDIDVYGRSTPGNGATDEGTAFVQVLIDGVEEVLLLHRQIAGSMAIHGSKRTSSITSGALLTFTDGWYGAGSRAELNWEITIRERPPWA